MRSARDIATALWAALGGAPGATDALIFEGAPGGLPSVYPVAEAAAAEVAVATLAIAELHAARTGGPIPAARVDRRHAVAAFRSERYLRPLGWELASEDDVADYEGADGWIRLHMNYAHHRRAALRALGAPGDPAAVRAAVRARRIEDLEAAIVAEGGCAAAMRTIEAWAAHPQGAAVSTEPLVSVDARPGAPARSLEHAGRAPLAGVRVLDMTRVIAGPVCTRFLSAYGADVLRVDPPGFAEVGALLPDMTAGKRRAALDLRRSEDRATFERLVAGADVLVCGYRSDALARLGYGARELRALNDALVLASLDAYGWTGPWRARRGFDSLVQMSSGIAARGGDVARVRGPKPLPAQALDHGTGYLLAAATCRALTRRAQAGETAHVRASLARTAAWLVALGESGDPEAPDFVADDARPWLETAPTAWGRVERVRCPGRVGSFTPSWTVAPGPLGSDSPGWES